MIIVGLLLGCLFLCASKPSDRPIREVLFTEGNDGTIVDLGNGNKAFQQSDTNAGGLFEYDCCGFRLPWGSMTVETIFRIDSYSGNSIVPLEVTTSGFGSTDNTAVKVALRIRNDRFEICDGSNSRVLQDLGPVVKQQFYTVHLFVDGQQRSVRVLLNGQKFDLAGLIAQAAGNKAPGWVRFGASTPSGQGGTSVVTFDSVAVGQGEILPSSPPKAWDYYLDGSSRPIDISGSRREIPADSALFVQGDTGAIVDLGNGNQGIQQSDLNTQGMFECDTYGMRLPWTQVSFETRFRVDSYSGNHIVPLQITSGPATPTTNIPMPASPNNGAISVALRIRNGRFELCDGATWRVLRDLGPVVKQQFNTINLCVDGEQRCARAAWNGQEIAVRGLAVASSTSQTPTMLTFGACNSEGRGRY